MSIHLMRATALCSFCVLAACGGDKPAAPPPAAEAPAAAKPEPAPAPAPAPAPEVVAKPDANGVVQISGNDMMKYNATRIEVSGTHVKLTLTHVGKQPKVAMGHNLVVLKPGTDPMAFGGKAAGAQPTDYIPESEKGSIIAHTKLLGGGESDTIEFDLPAPGEYPFMCSFPGHFATMKGVLVATAAEEGANAEAEGDEAEAEGDEAEADEAEAEGDEAEEGVTEE